ncbi:MAG: ABC transporter ATP-binding protein [Oscillospiraceae bacterium]
MLEAQNISLVYPDGDKQKVVLDSVSITVQDGETVALVGPSGSGKSSLIYLLSALKKPSSGEVFFNGASLSGKKDTAAERYEHFGFIFQQHFLIPYLSVLENVSVAMKSAASTEKARTMLQKLGLEEHLHKKPHQISGGQRQRVAIARALVKEPQILFADEPTASLDHATATEVMELIRHIGENTTLIIATHDTSLLRDTDRVITVNNQQITERCSI